MHLIHHFLASLSLLQASSASSHFKGQDALSTRLVNIEHTTMKCNRTFEDTSAALENLVPQINTTYQTLLAGGDIPGALLALQSLPVLNSFIVPPRNFGRLLSTLNKTGRALQYEIGNPYTANRMNYYELDISLYAPIRVLLREENGVAMFEFDRPRSTMGQFGNIGVDDIANQLDRNLTAVLMEAAGWTV